MKQEFPCEYQFIVTTTISSPSKALKLFAHNWNWTLIVVGDMKTPHAEYEEIFKGDDPKRLIYLRPDYQASEYPDLSESIGWNTIQRRNIGFIEAYRRGAQVVATVDDDNIPYDDWGKHLLVGKEMEVDLYHTEAAAFDPLSITRHNHLWHRGFPIDLLQERHKVQYAGKTYRRVLVQADLWDGDPDVDAMARLTYKPCVKFDDITQPYCSDKIAPFNSQNTFLAREVLPFYAVLPFVGRMDDIWGSYILQQYFPDCVVYNRPSVFQERNPQDLITNLEKEIDGYRNTINWITNFEDAFMHLPQKTMDFWQLYSAAFHKYGPIE